MKWRWKMWMARLAKAVRARDFDDNARLPRRRSAAGFTLLEVMIVLAIIAAIASGVGVVVFNNYKRAQVKIAKERVKEVMQGVTTFMIDNNNCPQSLEQLVGQKYLSKGAAKDPWGKEFTLRCPGTNDPEAADISSAGPDKTDGTPDDIKSWEL
jgi:general secretion pathway protein G